jgi:hypothetical protein
VKSTRREILDAIEVILLFLILLGIAAALLVTLVRR